MTLPASSNFYLPCQKSNWLHTVPDQMQTQPSNSGVRNSLQRLRFPDWPYSLWLVPTLIRLMVLLTSALVSGSCLERPLPDCTPPHSLFPGKASLGFTPSPDPRCSWAGVVCRVSWRRWTTSQACRDGGGAWPLLSLSHHYFLPAALNFLDASCLPFWIRGQGLWLLFVSLFCSIKNKTNNNPSYHVLCAKHWIKYITIFTSFS